MYSEWSEQVSSNFFHVDSLVISPPLDTFFSADQ